MLEIKFRGLVVEPLASGEKWITSDGESHELYINKAEKTAYIEGHQVVYESLTQYTGLKDKNGVEIYDGDIIAVYNKSYVRKATVEWLSDRAKYVLVFENLQVEQLDVYVEELYETIGNIYENTELNKIVE